MTTIKENNLATLATYAYDTAGRRMSVTLGNGNITSYSYYGDDALKADQWGQSRLILDQWGQSRLIFNCLLSKHYRVLSSKYKSIDSDPIDFQTLTPLIADPIDW